MTSPSVSLDLSLWQNPQHNSFVEGIPATAGEAVVEKITLPGFHGEEVLFILEWQGHQLFHVVGAVEAYSAGQPSALFGKLPTGPSLLLQHDGAWLTSEGPVKRLGTDLQPRDENYFAPHGGPWCTTLGLFAHQNRLAMWFFNNGGPRGGDTVAFGHLLTYDPDAAAPKKAITRLSYEEIPGYFTEAVQCNARLAFASKSGLILSDLNGKNRQELAFEGGIRNLGADQEANFFGGFLMRNGRSLYVEFDPSGNETFSHPMGSDIKPKPGRVIHMGARARLLVSGSRLLKLDAEGNSVWTKRLVEDNEDVPRPLVFSDGSCAYLDGANLMLLDPEGTEQQRIPLPSKRLSSPPCLMQDGSLWVGLRNEAAQAIRIRWKE